MSDYDMSVRRGGRVLRLVSKGGKGVLLGANGAREEVAVSGVGPGMPTVTGEDGMVITLGRAPRPCSCKGAPWSTPVSTIFSQL